MKGGILGKGMTMEMEEAVIKIYTCVQPVNYGLYTSTQTTPSNQDAQENSTLPPPCLACFACALSALLLLRLLS
jgi:hypothetical protein